MGKSIRLADGTLLEPKINFLTIKLFQETGLDQLQKRFEKKPNDQGLQMECASKFIYALIRSSGRRVDEEDALSLVSIDDMDALYEVINDFAEKLEKFKKKPVGHMTKKKKQ